MKRTRPAKVRLDPELHRVLREEAARHDRSVADLVNSALRQSLPRAIQPLPPRPKTPVLLFESVLKGLKRRGKI